jgi:DHA2 family multidrug resistance protein
MERERDENLTGAGGYFILSLTSYPRAASVSCNRRPHPCHRLEVTWVLTSYIVANGIMIPLTRWISARFGRKRYFICSVVVFVVASGRCGAAMSLPQIVVFRLLQGAAGAAMIPSSQAIMMETFPPQEQALRCQVWGMGMLTSPLPGPTLRGWITYNWTWRWCFYINLPLGFCAVLMVIAFLHDPEHIRKSQAAARTGFS